MDAAANARKQVAIAEEELRKERAAKASVEVKIGAEKRALEIATARRSACVGNLGQSSSDADSTKWHKKIDEEEAKIKNSTRLLEALEAQLRCANETIQVYEEDRVRFQQQIAAAEYEQAFQQWTAQATKEVDNVGQLCDAARSAYGRFSKQVEEAKQRFGPRALVVLEALQDKLKRQHNPGAVGWKAIPGNMLNPISIAPMERHE